MGRPLTQIERSLSIDRALVSFRCGGCIKVDACVVDESVLIYRKDEPQELFGWTEPELEPSTVQVSPDDPRLTEVIIEGNPEADAFEPLETLAIH